MPVGVELRDALDNAGVTSSVLPVVEAKREPKISDRQYRFGTLWYISRNPSEGNEGDLWYYARSDDNGDAQWSKISYAGGTGAIDTLTGNDSNAVGASGSGNVNVLGQVVANGTHSKALYIAQSGSANTVDANLQLAAAVAATPADSSKAGVAQFNNAHFSVDVNGFVSLAGGGIAIDGISVQAASGTGTDPVAPDGSGNVAFVGSAIAAAGTPVRVVSNNANEADVEVQFASAQGSSSATHAGLSSYNNLQFITDSNGFVSINSNTRITNTSVQTTNATPTDVQALISIPDDYVITIKGMIAAQEANSANHIGGTFEAVVTTSGGSASVVGTSTENVQSDFSTATFTVTTSGNDLIIQVTGEAATTIDWLINWELFIQS